MSYFSINKPVVNPCGKVVLGEQRRNVLGYRNYIGKISREDLTKLLLIHEKPDSEEKFEMMWDFQRNVIDEMHEIGKYYDTPDDGFEVVHDLSDEDTELKIITHDSIKAIIRQYAQKHLDYLKDLMKPEEEMTEEEKFERKHGYKDTLKKHIESQIRQWERPEDLVYDIDLDSDRLVKSWNFQYELFELLHIYKSFDRENDYVVYTGR